MKADTWMPLYIADYARDTPHLNTEQHGAYMLLLMACWTRGGVLPADPGQLAAIARLTPAAWRRMAPVILPFFRPDEAGYRHKRVTEEHEKASRIASVARENGRRGGRPRSQTEPEENPAGYERVAQTETPAGVARPSPLPSEVTTDAGASVTHAQAGEFEEWWKAYPHQVGIGPARAVFGEARTKATLAELISGARRYAASKPKDRQWCNPAKWLTEERWRDQPADAAPGHAEPIVVTFEGPAELRAEIAAQLGEAFAGSYVDPAHWKPTPPTIVTRTGFAADKIRKECAPILRKRGVSVEQGASA